MPNLIDRTGQRFGRLLVLRRAGLTGTESTWDCACDCGGMAIDVRSSNLRSGNTRSCGCMVREFTGSLAARLNLTHGHAGYDHRSRAYRSWESMKRRCTNSNHKYFKHYGGAGVKVCDRWLTFENFLADMGERPRGTSLSRLGDVGNYEPGNCAWHTVKQQRAEARKKFALAQAA
jgi:hypothetical protein